MKHTTYFNLLDALKEDGCPICAIIKKAIHKSMDDFLYEQVNDPAIRKQIKESFGFCNRHAWQFQKLGNGFSIRQLNSWSAREEQDRFPAISTQVQIRLRVPNSYLSLKGKPSLPF